MFVSLDKSYSEEEEKNRTISRGVRAVALEHLITMITTTLVIVYGICPFINH